MQRPQAPPAPGPSEGREPPSGLCVGRGLVPGAAVTPSGSRRLCSHVSVSGAWGPLCGSKVPAPSSAAVEQGEEPRARPDAAGEGPAPGRGRGVLAQLRADPGRRAPGHGRRRQQSDGRAARARVGGGGSPWPGATRGRPRPPQACRELQRLIDVFRDLQRERPNRAPILEFMSTDLEAR